MSKHIYISQNTRESNTSNTIVKKIYDMILQQELTGDVYDNTTDFFGHVALSNPVYKEWADKVTNNFENLVIESLYYMLFQDPNIESVMSAYLLSKGLGDGVGITYDDAKNKKITSLPSFKNNKTIEYFNELPYFEKVTTLQTECFGLCSNLKEIDLSNITTLSESANGQTAHTFEKCTSLYKVILGNINCIPKQCFNRCTNLEIVENSKNITTIHTSGFAGCTSLENIDLSNLTDIHGYGFQGCSLLGTVNLDNIITIGYQSFGGCTNLKLENSTLSNCTSIGESGFSECKLITEIILPICTSIGKSVFKNCSALTNVSIPNITSIEESAFIGCTSLQNFDLSNITNIGKQAFYNGNLQTVNLTNVTTLGYQALFHNYNLTLTTGNLPNLITIGQQCFEETKISSLNIPNCQSIGIKAFRNCKSLTTVTTNCTDIGMGAFTDCTNLQTISNLTDIIATTTVHILFNNCTSLVFPSHITINNSYIGYSTFYCCGITSVTLGTNVKSLYRSAFNGCSQLTTINGLENITHIGSYTFKNCKNLEGIINLSNLEGFVTGKIDTIDQSGSTQIFYNCKKITKVILGHIPNITLSPWTAEDTPFRMCAELHTVDISSIDKINLTNNPLFSQCPAMRNFVLRCDVPTTTQDNVIGNTKWSHIMPNTNGKIYVPDEYLNNYKTAQYWSDIANHIYPLSEYVEIQD